MSRLRYKPTKISFSMLIFLFTSSWAGVGASEGIDASDGVVSVEDWVSFKVTLSVGSRLLSVDSWLAVESSLIVTLVLFFRTADQIFSWLIISYIRCLAISFFRNSSDDGQSFFIFFQISVTAFWQAFLFFSGYTFSYAFNKVLKSDNWQNLPCYLQWYWINFENTKSREQNLSSIEYIWMFACFDIFECYDWNKVYSL